MTEVYKEGCMKFFWVAITTKDGLDDAMSILIAPFLHIHCCSLIEPWS
jgi:hypothetical protein